MRHVVAFKEPGTYAGWPANHGSWQWGDEFLCGFLKGPYGKKSMHNIREPFSLSQIRSKDGGETWVEEYVDIPVNYEDEAVKEYSFSGDTIIRVRGSYDHGGDFIAESGFFYASEDRGSSWSGPYKFCGLDFPKGVLNTSRTSKVSDLFLFSIADSREWGSDKSFCARLVKNEFQFVGTICDYGGRAVMPVAEKLPDGAIVALCRRRISGRLDGWIESFISSDDGENWVSLGEVGGTGRSNGNPPAISKLKDGRLFCSFADRSSRSIVGATSYDGRQWDRFTIRDGGLEDIGYPQIFIRRDGIPVVVYYWADSANKEQHISATMVDVYG